MIKAQFLERLKEVQELNFPINRYLIGGSGPLAIRNIREARDLDILLDEPLWNELTKTYPIDSEKETLIRIGEMEIWNKWPKLNYSIEEMTEVIEGFPFMKLCYLIEWKKWQNREKDRKDLELIENYLKKNIPLHA